MTEIEKLFEEEAIEKPPARQRQSKPIDITVAQEIIKKHKSNGNALFGMPVLTINELCGYGKIDKLRVRQIQNRLNEQHSELLDEGKEFWLGTAGNKDYYTFDIKAKSVKKPSKKKED